MRNNIDHLIIALIFITAVSCKEAESNTQITFNQSQKNTEAIAKNPFLKFVGEWTLKDDSWTQNWGYGTETIKILNHHTVCSAINTSHSLLSVIDGPEPNGHIFWVYNPVTEEVSHLSSFGDIRIGKGSGALNENADLKLKISFEGEAKGTYRIYNYKWTNTNEYHMKSVQYAEDDTPTGLFYEGTFVRIK